MLLQLNTPIYFEAPFTASKTAKTGLTNVTVNVWRNGTSVVSGAAATEVGDGLYSYTLLAGNVSAAGSYVAVFKTTDTTVDSQIAYSLWRAGEAWVERVDATILSRSTYAGGAVASVAAPVTVGTNNDKSGYSLATAPPSAAAIRQEIDSNSTKLDATVSSRSSHSALDVWLVSLGAAFLPNTLGKKLKDWVLGTDGRALLSANAHVSGATVNAEIDLSGISVDLGDVPEDVAAIRARLADQVRGEGPLLVLPAPPGDVSLCRVYGYFETGAGLPAVGVQVKWELIAIGPTKSERILVKAPVISKTNALGQLCDAALQNPWLDLQRNDQLTPDGTTWEITCMDAKFVRVPITLQSAIFDLSSVIG